MVALLSPRELADVLGVSESSLKRWIDAGRIRATRTEGGHRRITIEDALSFIRESNALVVRPELLGLVSPRSVVDPGRDREPGEPALIHALRLGDAAAVAATLRAYLAAGDRIAALCDGPIRRAMHAIGELWQHDLDGVVIEHRATDACVQALASLRIAIAAAPGAPIALGGAPEDDPYILPSAMAALVLASEGFRTINLGPDTPTGVLHRAVALYSPALVWISASSPLALAQAHELAAFVTRLPDGVAGVVGGRHAGAIAQADPRVRVASSMVELVAIARALQT
jgi:MerR family transcriptional regulator, light-induced transcriptional regulator